MAEPITGAIGRVATLLTTLLGLAATVLGGVLALGGGADRLARDRGQDILIALVLAACAMVVLVAVEIGRPPNLRRNVLILLSVVLFAIAVFVLVNAGQAVASNPIRPSIAAQIVTDELGTQRVKSEVSSSSLRSDDVLGVSVWGLGAEQRVLIYHADIGAGPDGRASVAVDQPLSASLYDSVEVRAWSGLTEELACQELLRPLVAGACAALPIPVGDLKPQLNADIEGAGADRAVKATVRLGSTHVIGTILRITVRNLEGQVIAFYDTLIRPDAQGRLNRAVRLPIPDVDSEVCVVAFTVQEEGISRAANCPLLGAGVQPDVVFDWVQIRVRTSESTAAPSGAP